MKISSNFHKSKKGIAKAPPKRKFFGGNKTAAKISASGSSDCLHNPGVVNSKELVCGSNHVNSVRFTLGAFAVKELVNRLTRGLLLNDYLHDLK